MKLEIPCDLAAIVIDGVLARRALGGPAARIRFEMAHAADGRRFLAEFEERRASILDGLARLARGPLPT